MVTGLFKTEVIGKQGPWRSLQTVEYATPEWVDWFNNRRLLGPIGDVPPAERERAYYMQEETPAAWLDSHKSVSGETGVVQGENQGRTG